MDNERMAARIAELEASNRAKEMRLNGLELEMGQMAEEGRWADKVVDAAREVARLWQEDPANDPGDMEDFHDALDRLAEVMRDG